MLSSPGGAVLTTTLDVLHRLLCLCLCVGNGEAAGSRPNRPLPPILPPPPCAPDPSQADLPASSLALPHPHRRRPHLLLPGLLLRGPSSATATQPRSAAAAHQTRPLLLFRLLGLPAGPLQHHLAGRAGRYATSGSAQGPHAVSAGLAVVFAAASGGSAELLLLLARRSAPPSPLWLAETSLRPAGVHHLLLHLLTASGHLLSGLAGPAGLQGGAGSLLID